MIPVDESQVYGIDIEDKEHLLVQLAGISVAALGLIQEEHLAHPGDYGWSPLYQEVVDLRIKYEKLLLEGDNGSDRSGQS